MYPHLGNAEKLEEIRSQKSNCTRCAFLRKDPNACESLPEHESIAPDKVGTVCPNNVYAMYSDVFEHRDGVMDTIDRLLRLANSAEIGIIGESELSPLDVSELIATKNELDRQSNNRQKQEYERSKREAQANQRQDLPSWDK